VIYECGPRCKCNERGGGCPLRLTQSGIAVPLEVFHDEHKGWGVRTLKELEKNQV
jgi:[histone H3]-lysine9 N-trimethyltransferase EHMT